MSYYIRQEHLKYFQKSSIDTIDVVNVHISPPVEFIKLKVIITKTDTEFIVED